MKVIRVTRNDLGTTVWTSTPLDDPKQIDRIETNLKHSMSSSMFTITTEELTAP